MFDHPAMLWLLALAPVVGYPALVAMRRGTRAAGAASALLRLGCLAALVAMIAGLRIPGRLAARRVEVVALLDQSRSIARDQRQWMQARVRALASAMNPHDSLAIIGFGRDAQLGLALSDPRLVGQLRLAPDRGATDIAAALTSAKSLFSPDADKRVLLLSDGNQTRGDAMADVPAMLADEVRIFTAAPPQSSTARLALTEFSAPQNVRAEQEFTFHLSIESEARGPADAQLRLLNDGRPIAGRHVRLHPGLNQFALPYRFVNPGAHIMTADLAVDPPFDAINSRAEVPLSVSMAPHLLVASATRPESLMNALQERHYQVDLVTPRSLSSNATDYLPYQVVILDEVAASAIDPGVQGALSHYVADFGGGLIATGNTLRDDAYRGGELEKILPVNFEPQPPPPSREPIAVYLCIDRSNSMSYDSRYPAVRNGQRIRYAKEAAIALLRQLDDTDYAGVIAFDSQPYVLGHLQPLGDDRNDLEARIDRLQPGGGTDFKEALEIAEREILQSQIKVREIILLTDGDTNRQYHDHDALIASMAQDHIPVSTIRIGPDLENLRLLQDFAQATGGTFYRVQDIEKLPLLLVGLTREAMNRRKQGRTKIESGAPSQILTGIEPATVPPIDYYAASKAKDGSVVPLRAVRAGKGVPLVAAWQYGLGRTAVFAAQPDSLATLAWIRWDRYAQFWSQMVAWTMRDEDPGLFAMRIRTAADGAVTVTAEKADASPAPNLVCRITGPDRALDVPMTQVGASIYRGEAGPLPRGKYQAALMVKARDVEKVIARRQFASAGTISSDQAELRLRPADLDLLRRLARATQGEFNPSLGDVVRHTGATVAVWRTADPFLLPLAIILFLGEVFVRRRFLAD
jgi:Ca-activated chloride channel family protein